ncbi:hypothetical protein [Pseudomonas syringae]|uniref:hypothetical protein n=1 Tax=Pseudomonas syringae TaxID=317 RepID=UPI001F2FA480|nr:hypothetical protein [Pseudomonas syringae]MCF5374177.1 hypothetical protein [Pseudomonas syringae]
MKDVVMIRLTLIEDQHDALITFYDTYHRLYVNKLLLMLCEGCLPLWPPTLAHFETTAPLTGARERKIVIRLSRDRYPIFWKFYKDLPYGARSVVIINLMNRYAQLAEADKRLMDSIYWRGSEIEQAVPMPPEPAITLAPGGDKAVSEPTGNSTPAETQQVGSLAGKVEGSQTVVEGPSFESDPLSGVTIDI